MTEEFALLTSKDQSQITLENENLYAQLTTKEAEKSLEYSLAAATVENFGA